MHSQNLVFVPWHENKTKQNKTNKNTPVSIHWNSSMTKVWVFFCFIPLSRILKYWNQTTREFNVWVYHLLNKIVLFLNKYFARQQIIYNKRRFLMLYHLNIWETNDLWKNVFVCVKKKDLLAINARHEDGYLKKIPPFSQHPFWLLQFFFFIFFFSMKKWKMIKPFSSTLCWQK